VDARFAAFLQKPIDLDVLAATVLTLVQRPSGASGAAR